MQLDSCPGCGRAVYWAGRGRRPLWCSQACRRAAYEGRRASASGAIAVRVVERERVIERVRTEYRGPTAQDCVKRVLESPRACREVINGLAAEASQGRLHSGAHTATVAAIERLVQALIDSGTRPNR